MTESSYHVDIRSPLFGSRKKPSNIEFLPLLIALAIACAIAILSIRYWTDYKKWREETQRHELLLQHANALLSDVTDAETGQRGYLLTGREPYLAPYRESLSHIRAELSALALLTNDNEQNRPAALKNIVEQKLTELQQTIDLRARNGLAAALDIVQTDRGKLLMDQMRTNLSGILSQEAKAAQAARDHLQSSAVVLQWVSILGSLTLVGLLLTAQTALRIANTKRLRLIAELQSSRNKLERSNAALERLNSDLELFAYAAGHDLQEPLRTIGAFSELVARKLDGNEETVQHIRFIQAAVGRIRAMIDGLLHYSHLMRDGKLPRAEVRMDDVVGEALLNCRTAISESQALIHVGPLPNAFANRQQMVQLFQNLISNAIKYRSDKTPEIQISVSNSNTGDAVFTVRDNGVGFDMRYAEEIFRLFRRLHAANEFTGTGLGLAMCKRIVELHGGRIWAESQPGDGSIFRFTVDNRL